ncbi:MULTISPECIES: response regulator transcription factor [Gordonia]|uniref:Response regulator transcription factor n=1 Tax=Gordonia hongkongensis TaxID=1701090 RepID=A0ABT6BX51_9ACTN|nr:MULTISPECIES: response regulator transcription factor [Gordonia]MCZ4535593.1 response regulator transcription factor [Gordonia terrae]MCT1353611.1 response regulator transcription factor [Gordonia sp. p3-SID1431]MDF6101634.1 response regulator transcription factor [Gordonia hongkongensis]MDT0219706.1 response regulator transcription factor [Gordonia sp. AC31]OCH78989.1 DNA-binding response regulator [Gordonia sp. UCD-TK1]
MPITVVIADDQAMVRQGFSALLAAQPDLSVLGDAADGVEAVEVCRRVRPDVVLMDVRMPRKDGLWAAEQILASSAEPPTRVLMLTTFDIDDYVYEALRIGASGFLLKDAPADELVRAVRVVAAGEALLAPSITRRLITEVTARRRRPARDQKLDTLTPREREVLDLVADGKSNAEIGADLFVTEQTVKTHVSSLLNKLRLRDRAQAVVFAYENGIK